MYKIIGVDGREYGPVPADELRKWIALGRADARTMARLEGTAQWKPLSQFPEFANLPQPAPARVDTSMAKTSGLAIASLVLGILGLLTCGITSVVGLILGIIALTKIHKNPGLLSGTGLAIAGICVSGCFLFFVPIQAGLLLPALAKAKQKAQAINCQNNLKQLGLAIALYAGDNNDRLPPAVAWSDAILKTAGSSNIFHCPADRRKGRSSYAFNQRLEGKKRGEVNPKTVLLFESDAGWNGAGGPELLASGRHPASRLPYRGRTSRAALNVLFVDGSVSTMPESALDALRWDP